MSISISSILVWAIRVMPAPGNVEMAAMVFTTHPQQEAGAPAGCGCVCCKKHRAIVSGFEMADLPHPKPQTPRSQAQTQMIVIIPVMACLLRFQSFTQTRLRAALCIASMAR